MQGQPVHVLFVCTANRIRSPFAAAVANRMARDSGIPVVADSAGFGAAGLPAMDQMIRAAERFDIDLTDHLSRQLDATILESSHLVLTMTGRHVLDVGDIDSSALGRTLMLREAADGALRVGTPQWNAPAVRRWSAELTARPIDVLLRGELDVPDPVGRSQRVHRRTASEITDLVSTLLGCGADAR